MLDRTVPPPINEIGRFHFSWPQAYTLQAGLPLFVLHTNKHPITKLELISKAGTWYESHNGVAYFTAKMLQEGSQQSNAQDIAQYIDQYGASLHVQIYPDTCTLSLTVLSKHLAPMLTLLTELLLTPTFPAHRLEHVKHLKTQALRVEAKKNRYVARKRLKEILFGKTHPYGKQITEATMSNVTQNHLQQYYTNKLLAGCQLVVSGQVYDRDLQTIQQSFQQLPIQVPHAIPPSKAIQLPTNVHVSRKKSLQAAITMGKVLWITKDHPDYLPLLVVNELLGGYFGSRLMRNIREDKGYTYGIFSKIISLQHASYLLIATEVIQEFAQATCQEIAREIKNIQTVPIPDEELSRLQQHMLGTFLSEVNHPFAVMEKFKAVHLHGLDQAYYKKLYDTIKHINATQIMELAIQYLAIDSFSSVIVG